MTKNQTQKEKVKEHLVKYGYVRRNWALRNYISRLSAIVYELRDEGWTLKGDYVDTKNGRDYKYELISLPRDYE